MPEAGSVPARTLAWPVTVIGAAVCLMLAGTIALWAHYGTAVCFEMIRAGLAACFG